MYKLAMQLIFDEVRRDRAKYANTSPPVLSNYLRPGSLPSPGGTYNPYSQAEKNIGRYVNEEGVRIGKRMAVQPLQGYTGDAYGALLSGSF